MLKKMNKIIMVMVLLVVILATGCSKPEKKVADNNGKSDITETKSEDTVKEETFEKGVRTDTTYENKILKLKFALPEGYLMATDEEVAQMMGVGLDAQDLTDEQREAAEKISYEMVAQNPADASSVIIMAEKLPLSSMTEEQYLQMSIDTAVKANQSGEIGVTSAGETTEVELGGQTFVKSGMSTTLNEMTMIQDMYAKKAGDYMVVITLSYVDDTAMNTMIGSFQPIS